MMRDKLSTLLASGLFALLGLTALIPFWSSGFSFYTYHSLSGLMALKHQIALTLLRGEYPLWNPMILCGVPFHSGIGILDPFLISYSFLKGVHALLGSSYLALVFSAISMFLYLRKSWALPFAASILGGVLYMFNPFFAATAQELPFMAPPVYLPFIFLCYDSAVKRRSIGRALFTGFFMSLTFLGGNLQSFIFILFFFLMLQLTRLAGLSLESKTLKPIGRELGYLFLASLAPFLFAAIDLAPTMAMIFNSARDARSILFQNIVFFAEVGIFAMLLTVAGNYLGSKLGGGMMIRFAIAGFIFGLLAVRVDTSHPHIDVNSNLFYPLIDHLMVHGREAFYSLLKATGGAKETLRSYLGTRNVFEIQPPIYIFTLATALIFSGAVGFSRHRHIRIYSLMALLMILFPYTSCPDLNARIFKLREIAYARVMFGFFFMQTIVLAYSVSKILQNQKWDACPRIPVVIVRSALIAGLFLLVGFVVVTAVPFNVPQFKELLESFNQIRDSRAWGKASILCAALTMQSLRFFISIESSIGYAMILKYVSLIALLFLFLRSGVFWKYLFLISLTLEALLAWQIFTFQTRDIQFLIQPHEETEFFKAIGPNERIGTVYKNDLAPENFYERQKDFLLLWNAPIFWGVKTVEGHALNLAPKLFGDFFWNGQRRNIYTPTEILGVPDKRYQLMGMNYLYSDQPIRDPTYQEIKQGEHYRIYRNIKALPRFYFAKKLDVRTEETIADAIQDPAWNPEDLTLIERPQVYSEEVLIETGAAERGRISVTRERGNEIILHTDSSQREFLATTDAYDDAWRVYVDGKSQPVVKTNFYFRGVFLDGGQHTVRFIYKPWTFYAGVTISVLSLILLLVAASFEVVGRIRRGRTAAHVC